MIIIGVGTLIYIISLFRIMIKYKILPIRYNQPFQIYESRVEKVRIDFQYDSTFDMPQKKESISTSNV